MDIKSETLLCYESSSDEEEDAAISTVISAVSIIIGGSMKRKRSCWVKAWKQQRNQKGSFSLVQNELKITDLPAYKNYLRMDDRCFKLLLSYVQHDIERQETLMRSPVSPAEKLTATIRFLATGENYQSLEYQTRLSKSFLQQNIPLICDSIYSKLKTKYLKFPSTKIEWENIAEKFAMRWQFPLCLGALDGKHIAFRSKAKDGSYYFNYKGFNSIVLLALVDADCKFIFIDIGCNGRVSDGGVLLQSKLMNIIGESEKYFPNNKLYGNNRILPYTIVADDAFPLQRHIMKPYPFKSKEKYKQVFNLRLSRARHTVEHAFGILANRFKVFQSPTNLNVEKVISVVQAACALHNFLIEETGKQYMEGSEEALFNVFFSNESTASTAQNPSRGTAENVRREFAEYFLNEGKLDWQDSKL